MVSAIRVFAGCRPLAVAAPGASPHAADTMRGVIIPLGTDRPLRRPTLVNHVLLGVNLLAHTAQVLAGVLDPESAASIEWMLRLDPRAITAWSLVTYSFLHADALHLLGNLVFLWVFGGNVEDRFGRLWYLAFYVGAAAVSGGLHCLFEAAPVVGASGAIAGVTGAYLVLFPYTTIRCFVLFLVIGTFGIPAVWFIVAQIAYNVFLTSAGAQGNVATVAHLGGYAFGIGVSMLLLATRLLTREPYDLFTISRQAARRRQFREIKYQQARSSAAPARPVSDPDEADARAAARSEVSRLISSGDLAGAGVAYRRLLEGSGLQGALLNRRAQYDLANHLFRAGDHQTAATAYDLFLKGYPGDSERPVVHLMLGLINARYLNDPIRAKVEIQSALPNLPEGEHRSLAKELLAELG